jgi:aminoglycoside phosphotransferase family enzyme
MDTVASPDKRHIARDRLGGLVHRLADRLERDGAGHSRRIIETHISYVLLSSEFAYKFKKPVDFGFVDFSTLTRRHHFCGREVELNKRFAPDLYLGVVAVRGTLTDPRIEGRGRALEYAVQMRRFDERARGDSLLERGAMSLDDMMQLADDVAAFHGVAERASRGSDYGDPRLIRAQMLDNLNHLVESDPEPSNRERYRRLRMQTRERLDDLGEVLARRKEFGFVRDCHGDLHLTNLVGLNGRLVPYDCIEFNDALRNIDVQSDVRLRRPRRTALLSRLSVPRTGQSCAAARARC